MAGELVGGAFLSAFLQVLFDRLASQEVVDLFRGKEPIVKLLTELKTTLLSVDLLLNDAEDKLIKDQKVRRWLEELKEAVYDADDLVYKIDSEALRNELEGESQNSFTSKVLMKLNPTSFTAFDKAIKPEIDEILERLKVLLAPSNNPGLRIVEIKKQPERLPAPLVEESDVYGRDVDKEAIIQLLLSDDASGDPLSVIPIVGMGGIGKTTLAQIVYNDERLDETFNCKVWVTDGEDKFDLLKVMKIIFKNVSSTTCEIEQLYDLQIKLKKVLTGKKFLFVLDDVWDKDPHKWDVLKSSFKSGLRGSKIIVTTRNQEVMKTELIHHLDRISNEDGWRLFAKHSSIDVDPSDEYADLQVIGREIVDKCKGLPLAIKSLGSVLRNEKNKREWFNILNSDIWELYEKSKIGILPALWLSYYYLPSHLKSCFAYCAIFPKGYGFIKEYMVLLWMAEGLLYSKNGKRMEEVGEEYFEELISRSFFQPSSKHVSQFLMHDLMHDLAYFVSSEFSFKLNDDNLSDRARKIRHFSYQKGLHVDAMTFEGLFKAKGLRTILALPLSLFFDRGTPTRKTFSFPVEYLFKSLQSTGGCLRVLSFCQCHITKLPDSIGDLKYLRFLDLSWTHIEEIPDTVCNLYNLQTLLLVGCKRLTRLPMNIGNLINLRHLCYSNSIKEMPLQIGKIKTLQRIGDIVLGKNSGSYIKVLKELQDLSGTLDIKGLENVADVKDVLEADLKNKKFLRELILGWHDSHVPNDSQKEREVLDALEPHANLEELFILDYKGTSFPNWVGDHLFVNIVRVWLNNCKNCCFLPPLGQLPSLKDLHVSGFDSVERITSEFYFGDGSSAGTKPFRSLESLRFSSISKLREWLFVEGEIEGGVFPRLKEIKLASCPRLKVSLPNYLPSLEIIEIWDCDQLMPLVPRGQQMDAAFPSLETMIISYCGGQELLLEGGLPLRLKELSVSDCENLKALDEGSFQHLNSLETLKISGCENLSCLPKGLSDSLSHLSIRYCDLLTPRLQRETGEDWPIVAHIPSLNIRPDPDVKNDSPHPKP